MADGLRALRWRAALGVVGVGLVFAWVAMSGRLSHTIQIDFSWVRETLQGASVEIDGEIVGTLEPWGRSNWVTGFTVEPGEHVVRVLLDGCTAVPDTVRLGGEAGRLAVFMADVDDGMSCRVLLRGG